MPRSKNLRLKARYLDPIFSISNIAHHYDQIITSRCRAEEVKNIPAIMARQGEIRRGMPA
jgi:aspartyl aminopeptidase